MANRRELPDRRNCRSYWEAALGHRFHVTVGFYKNGEPGEVFMASNKIGSDSEVILRDMAIAASLALQYGCPVEELASALTRSPDGKAESPLGVALDRLLNRPTLVDPDPLATLV